MVIWFLLFLGIHKVPMQYVDTEAAAFLVDNGCVMGNAAIGCGPDHHKPPDSTSDPEKEVESTCA